MPLGNSPVVARFQRARWHPLRVRIHDMKDGDTMTLGMDDYNLAHASVDRFNDAYLGARRWKMTRRAGVITICHTVALGSGVDGGDLAGGEGGGEGFPGG